MKKLIAVMLCALLLISLLGCGAGGSKSTSSETYNGITRTETTTTASDGSTTTVVTYTDANGNAMDQAAGKAAFDAAKAEIEGTGESTGETTSLSGDTMSITIDGITRTETTTTVNGETKTEVTYTDADGNVLDPADCEPIFEAALAAAESDN